MPSLAFTGKGQIIWSEDFGIGCNQNQMVGSFLSASGGIWSDMVVGANSPDANIWYVSATEGGLPVGSCGDGCINNAGLIDATLHIGNVATSPAAAFFCPTGDCGAAYDAGGFLGNTTTNTRAVSPVINCSVATTPVFLVFKYMEGGQGLTDNFTVDYFDGLTWTQIADPIKTPTTCPLGQGLWTIQLPVALPVSAIGNPNVQIGFTWTNDNDGVGNDPSVAIDSVVLFAIPPPVVAAFSTPNVNLCNGDCISFSNNSVGNITSCSWSFQGGTPGTSSLLVPPSVCYNVPGLYDVQLIVSDGITIDTLLMTQYITVNNCNPPVASFSASQLNLCEGDCIDFFDLSINTPNQWQWIFNGSSTATSNLQSPTGICYSTAGTYDVQLVSTNQYGSDTLLLSNYINVINCSVPPIAGFSASQTTICETQCISFTDTSSPNPIAWQWNFPGGVPSSSNLANPSVCYPTNGIYNVSLLVSNAFGQDSILFNNYITVQVCTAPVASFAVSNDTLCSTTCIVFTDQSSSATSWLWSFPGAVPSSFIGQVPPSICYNSSGNYIATLVVNNLFGTDTISMNIVADSCSIPSPYFSASDSAICPNQCISFHDSSANNPVGWFWQFPGGTPSTSSAQNPPFVCYNTPGTYPVSLLVFNAVGADSVTISNFITVFPYNSPVINPSVSTMIIGNSVQLNASNGISYAWFPSIGLSDDSIPNPIASPATTTTYVITSVDANGCVFDTTAVVNILPPNTVWAPNAFTPNADSYNDIFYIYTTGAIDQFEFRIYDRWGNEVFGTKDSNEGWDGTFFGQQVEGGIYLYVYKITYANGDVQKAKGDILLIR